MTTISSDTSVMDILSGGSSAEYFGVLEESNELSKESLDRQRRIADEMEKLSSSAGIFRESIETSYKQATNKLYEGIVNPLKSIRAEASASYTTLTESVHAMGMGVSQKLIDVKEGFKTGLSNVKEGFTTSVHDLKTGFTDAVKNTNEFLDGMSIKMEAFKNLPTEEKLLLAGKTIADGVISSVSAIPNIISTGMESLEKGISAVGNFTKSSSKFLKGLFQKSEESDDVGGTSSVGPNKKDTKEDSAKDGAGLGALIGKLIPTGLIKSLGKVGKLAGKLALPLVAIMGIFDFVGGVQNAEDIIGKPSEQLSTLEKAGAGLASVVSGLTLGFISAKDIYSEGAQVVDSVSGFAKDMFNNLPMGVQDGLKKVSDVLFSSETGIFASIGRIFNENIDAISNGNYGELLLNVITTPLQMIFSSDGILANTFNGVMGVLPDSFKDTMGEFVDTIMGWFDTIKNFASDLIPDSLKSLVNGTLSSDIGKKASETVSKGFGAVKGFFGYGDDETDTKVAEKTSIREVAQKKKVESKNSSFTSREIKNNSFSSAIVPKSNTESESIIGENKGRVKTVTKRNAITAKAKNIKDSDTATKRSKEAMNKKQDVQPVIINQPAPAQKSGGSGKQLNTSTTIGDTELAVMNSNMMD